MELSHAGQEIYITIHRDDIKTVKNGLVEEGFIELSLRPRLIKTISEIVSQYGKQAKVVPC
jgi:hypothetical protein